MLKIRKPLTGSGRWNLRILNRIGSVVFLSVVPLWGQGALHAEPPAAAALTEDPCEQPKTPPTESGSAASGGAPYDWAGLCRYRAENQAAVAMAPATVILLGDSITANWAKQDPQFFADTRLNRGISGQTSAQMLLRFYQDVIVLKPKVVHIVAGTNDVARNVGSMGQQSFKNNIRAMVELAQGHGIKVVLGSIPPAATFPWRTEIQPVEEIRALNRWLLGYSRERHATFVDYYGAMATSKGALRDGMSTDGVHPNAAGYRLMQDLAKSAVARALSDKGR